ncbi:hypothetical protein [Paenibacillus lautus]|uniref:hypothetical protein n=1 Tax=Paenibacillus lautus TaxID=1401 RepID=UPI003D2B39EF
MANQKYVETRLPRNGKEGILFLLIISIISVNTIAPIIMGLERGFSKEVYMDGLKVIPIMWVIVVLCVKLIAGPLVGKMMPKFVGQTDGFNARVLLNIVSKCNGIISVALHYWPDGWHQTHKSGSVKKFPPYLASELWRSVLD